MKLDATKFICDLPKCRNEFVTCSDSATGAYLDLADAGWLITRPLISGWKHYCLDHIEEGKAR